MRAWVVVVCHLALAASACANTPGKHGVVLAWTASTTQGVTYNLYRGSAAGVCNGTPTPYVTGITSTTYADALNLTDGQTIFYNVSAVKGVRKVPAMAKCRYQIPVLPAPPSGLGGTPF